ncbi:hypothetical protein AB0J42_18505 [Nonomuraea sp. NPDC049649]|uniref:hypothetical protein n=1 Tax=Nonomuraea sp. NPDC049649 TaxID=3155776 RepID=UPI00344A1E91
MSLSDVIRNIAKSVTGKDGLKDKARDLPLLVVRGTLSAAGQALTLVDRVKNSIRGGKDGKEKEDAESRPSDATTPAAEEEKPARKEPVIFAPKPGAAEPNGTAKAKPDPVIFAPAKTDTAPETAAKPEPETKPKPEAETKPEAESKAAPEDAVAQPAVAQPVTMEPEKAEEQPKPKKAAKAKAEPAKAKEKEKLAEAAETVPAAAGSEPSLGAGELVEPIPGFASLSVASLRARMRGKTEEQIAEYLAYEQATSARPEVIRMYENRLAKLRSGA